MPELFETLKFPFVKILIVEDEKDLSESMVSYLREENYQCETAADYASAMEKIELFDYDCILLDITLPGGNGLTILKELRNNHKMDGVVIISAKNSLDDRITGLKSGADDYLVKPFHLSELSARIAAIIRRKNFDANNIIELGSLKIDTEQKSVYIEDTPVELTRKEYELLLYFISNKKKVISKNAIVEHLWGDEMGMAENYDFIYTHIKNLRKKLIEAGGVDYIKSVYGMGYKFNGQ